MTILLRKMRGLILGFSFAIFLPLILAVAEPDCTNANPRTSAIATLLNTFDSPFIFIVLS